MIKQKKSLLDVFVTAATTHQYRKSKAFSKAKGGYKMPS